jgi:hypothetical protein
MGVVRPDPGFLIVGIDDRIWREFCSWFTDRGIRPPPYVSDGVFVALDGPGLVAGCCVYPCDGPYAVVEYAATNPRASLKLAYEAMLFGAQALTAYGAMRKKTMLCFPVSRGMEKMLKRAGFETSSAPLMKHGPWSER